MAGVAGRAFLLFFFRNLFPVLLRSQPAPRVGEGGLADFPVNFSSC